MNGLVMNGLVRCVWSGLVRSGLVFVVTLCCNVR